jgi:CBS domain-containing protein
VVHILPESALYLEPCSVEEIMTQTPLSIRDDATAEEAAAFLTDRNIHAAPVINEAGRPVGVLSRSDLVWHERERSHTIPPPPDDFHQDRQIDINTLESVRAEHGYEVVSTETATVREMMTPVVFSVVPATPIQHVVEEMLKHHIHRLFVIDESGTVVGVVSSLDVLRRLRQPATV